MLGGMLFSVQPLHATWQQHQEAHSLLSSPAWQLELHHSPLACESIDQHEVDVVEFQS
jgi:hypothetical protein